jgi:hypothetical protein
MKQIILEPAFYWACPDCNADNFERSIPVDEQTMQNIKKQEGFYEFESSPYDNSEGWITYPDTVTCKNCNAEFEVDPSSLENQDIGYEEE